MRELNYPQLALLLLLGCLFAGLFWGLATSGVAYDPYNYDWNGGSDLRSAVGTGDTETAIALSTNEYEQSQPAATAAFVLEPGDSYSAGERAQLSSFIAQGGTLVVASAENDSSALLADLGSTVRIDGDPLRDEQNNLGDGSLPHANDVSNHELLRGVDELTLNHGTALDAGEAQPILNTSALAYLDRNQNEEFDENEQLESRPVVAVEAIGAGELIVVSDASAFTNAMLEQDGNHQFVENVAEGHETVILDYSQHGSLPPLSYGFILFREESLLQLIAVIVGLGIITLWGRIGISRRLRERSRSVATEPAVDDDVLASSLAERHPQWDDERVQRVTEAIIRTRQQEGSNE